MKINCSMLDNKKAKYLNEINRKFLVLFLSPFFLISHERLEAFTQRIPHPHYSILILRVNM